MKESYADFLERMHCSISFNEMAELYYETQVEVMELKAGNERLKTRIKYQHEDLAKVTPENRLLREEIERLKEMNDSQAETIHKYETECYMRDVFKENESLMKELQEWKDDHAELDNLALALSDKNDSYFAENEQLKADNQYYLELTRAVDRCGARLLREMDEMNKEILAENERLQKERDRYMYLFHKTLSMGLDAGAFHFTVEEGE